MKGFSKRRQYMQLKSFSAVLIGFISLMIPAAMNADTPGRHPAYLHARSDLRVSQQLMRVREEPNVTRPLAEASREVEAAIREIDRAAVLDHKDMDDHPRIDSSLNRHDRFAKIVALLRSARVDMGREEDNGRARGWRDAAYMHIDAALEHVHRAARDLHWDRELGW
jgi:hypothetical protein